jgi:cardiolipin synthase A/B
MTAALRCARAVRGWSAALGVALACACASPPAYGPSVEARPQGQPVHIENSKGARLSASQSAAVLDSLERVGKESDLLRRHIAIEEAVTGAPLVAGNKVTLLEDGPATYRAMFEAIRAARDHVNLEVYIFRDDDVGREFQRLLLAKQAQGVQVNVIYDSVGSIKTPRAFFDEMKQHGIRVLEFNPVLPSAASGEVNHRDHRKLLVADGRVAFVGGINIDDVYSSSSAATLRRTQDEEKKSGWRDIHVRIEGPVAGEFQKLFLEHWKTHASEAPPARRYFPQLKPAGDALVRALGATADDPGAEVYQTLLYAVKYAQKTVHLTVAYFIPDEQTVRVLGEAARRGVDVALILPGETDFWAVFEAGRSHYSELLEAGVKIYERKGALLHSKTAVVDGVWSSIGSTNWDPRSFVHNDEINAEILGRDFAAKMEQAFEEDLRKSAQIRAEAWQKRSLALRLKQWTARMWEYWL